jgi:hypothetical protein
MLQIDYKYKDCYVGNDFKTNIFIAAFATANARLNEMLDILGESVEYIMIQIALSLYTYIDNSKNTVKTGCLLGDWTDELGKDIWIVDWVSTGPKSYCYKTNTGEVVCKIKGFTLNYETYEKINSDFKKSPAQLVQSQRRTKTVKSIHNVPTQYHRITRDTKTKELLNKIETKEFGFVYDKRV